MQHINNHLNFNFMKKSTYFLSIVIVVLFFATMAFIAHKIIEINGALPIDFI